MFGGVGGRTSGGTLIRRVLVVVGFVGYIAAGFVHWAFGGLVAVPGAWMIVLWGMWLAGLWFTIRLTCRWSWWTLVSGPVALGIWWLYVTVGYALLGW
jgi:hypothetical protein